MIYPQLDSLSCENESPDKVVTFFGILKKIILILTYYMLAYTFVF